MSNIATDAAHALLDAMFGSSHAAGFPNQYHVGLLTTPPNEEVIEPAGNGYARVSVANTDANFGAAVGRQKTNATPIEFPTATGSWGMVGWYGLFSAATGGELLAWGALNMPISPDEGVTVAFQPGTLVVSVPGV